MVKIEKIKDIEILRFLFSLVIIFVHIKVLILKPFVDEIPFYQNLIDNFSYSYLPVDFFFIISGFFLFLTTDFGCNFIDFAKKKFLRLMPLAFYIIVLYWLAAQFTPIKFIKYENVFAMLTLNNCGLTLSYPNNHCLWYISALFWCMCFYFYLYKIINKKHFNFITACMIFFCYSLWLHSHFPHNWQNVYKVFNIGMLRGIAGLGVGYFISMIYKDNIDKIRQTNLKILPKILTTAAEIYLFCFIFYYICLHKMNYNNQLILIVAFIGLFWLFLIKKGWFSMLLENNFSVFLGKFAFPIFMTHFFILDLWVYTVVKNCHDLIVLHPWLNLVLMFITMILFGVITHYFVEQPINRLLKKPR